MHPIRRRLSMTFLVGLAAALPGAVACSAAPEAAAPEEGSAAQVERDCIVRTPLEADGYTSFAEVDAARVTRKVLDPSRGLVEDPVKTVAPTAAQLQATMKKISAYVTRVVEQVPSDLRRREVYSPSSRGQAMEPYCLFHAPGKSIYGTVVLFHGYNDRPHQQAKLASYLFHAGFDVYNVFLANQFMVEGKDYWPKTSYRPEVLAVVQQKLAEPANQAKLAPVLPRLRAGEPLTAADVATMDEVLRPELSIETLTAAWRDPGGDAYKSLFNWHEPQDGESQVDAARQADFLEYVRDARARLADLAEMPGPLFVGGLSVGGTLALAVTAVDGGRRVRGVVAHAPWFQSLEPKSNLQITFAGPLDDKAAAIGADYPIRWENHQIAMSPANIAANLALGSWTAREANVRALAAVPTAIVTTEAEDSADNAATGKLQSALTSNATVAPLHVAASYPRTLNVGHALTDPENYRDGAPRGWNRRFRTLYQESYRFYLTGALDGARLLEEAQDPDLPEVACRTPDFPERCR